MDNGLCVVVVDGDPEYRTFMQLLLEAEGYRTVLASSVSDVERFLAADRPHLIICDARLPDTAPFAVLDLLRRTPAAKGVPVVVCTGAVVEAEERRADLSREGVTVLVKPFDIDEMLALVAQMCGRPAPRDPGSKNV